MVNKKKKKSGFKAACFLLIAIVFIIIFLVMKNKIITNIQETNFFERVFGSTPEFVENHQTEKTEIKNEINEETLSENSTIKIKVQTEKKEPEKTEDKIKNEKEQEPQVVKQEVVEDNKKTENQPQKVIEESTPKTVTTQEKKETITTEVLVTELQLCFIEIDAEGSVIRKFVKRTIPKNDSPLSTAIKLLLEGPDTTLVSEKNCMTLIPYGTELLGVKIKDGIAYLDFSEQFEINSFGVEGYNAQLMQIVYTATNFPTVKSVQFLIEGEKKEYLGSEGQWIGSPLSKSSF